MSLDYTMYVHESDRAALQALKAVPGFSTVLKAFMKIWNEQLFYIENMSTNLKLSETQMAKYYNMLPPICEKLGIPVPSFRQNSQCFPNRTAKQSAEVHSI